MGTRKILGQDVEGREMGWEGASAVFIFDMDFSLCCKIAIEVIREK